MKRTAIILLAISYMFMQSCSEVRFGDAAFSDPPESSGATLDSMFNSSTNADRVLSTSYANLPYGLPTTENDKLGYNILESISDLAHSWRNNVGDGPRNLYYNGALSSNIQSSSAGTEAYRFGSEQEYVAIYYAWVYIENAYKIPDITEEDRNARIAEAKVNIAIAYFELLRYVGGVPIITKSVEASTDLEFPRSTFAQTVDFIVELLTEAQEDLPWYYTDMNVDSGRMTKAAAMALKLKVLCYAASDTFNSDTLWHSEADEYTCYGNYDASRWEAAYNAGNDFMTELSKSGYYQLIQPSEATHQARREAFRQAYLERGTDETIISIRKGSSTTMNITYLYGADFGPSLNYVNMFAWADGSDFPSDFDWSNPSTQPFFTSSGEPTRDPRLYETVVVPGELYYNDTVAPVHINHPNTEGSTEFTGFLIMKWVLQRSSDRNVAPHWAYMRYAEVLLNYAEAINEYKKSPTDAYQYVNQVRSRVGLSDLESGMSTLEFREALIKERAMEFGFEEVRWFDLVRWGLTDEFTKPIYKLTSVGVDDSTSPTQFTFTSSQISYTRAWASNWNSKWYFAPIPQEEIGKNYGMVQNPGW